MDRLQQPFERREVGRRLARVSIAAKRFAFDVAEGNRVGVEPEWHPAARRRCPSSRCKRCQFAPHEQPADAVAHPPRPRREVLDDPVRDRRRRPRHTGVGPAAVAQQRARAPSKVGRSNRGKSCLWESGWADRGIPSCRGQGKLSHLALASLRRAVGCPLPTSRRGATARRFGWLNGSPKGWPNAASAS